MMRPQLLAVMGCALLLAAGCASSRPKPSDMRPIDREVRGLQPDEPPASAPTAWYVMQKGDTFFSVARRCGISVEHLRALNPQITDLRAIPVGARIRVPAGRIPEGVPTNGAAPASPATPGTGHAAPVRYGNGFIFPLSGRVVRRFGDPIPQQPPARSRGIDLEAPAGTPVRAARGGLAAVLRAVPGYGQVIVIEHDHDMATFYGPVADVRIADRQSVSQGEVIAAVGARERLHVRLTRGGQPVDPLDYFPRP